MFGQISMFSWGQQGSQIAEEIKVGSVYRHHGPGDVIETAKVNTVGPDAVCIPHVVYEVVIERGSQSHIEERRTLNLQSFSEHFSETVKSQA